VVQLIEAKIIYVGMACLVMILLQVSFEVLPSDRNSRLVWILDITEWAPCGIVLSFLLCPYGEAMRTIQSVWCERSLEQVPFLLAESC
jgi:hypothetical protein